MKGQSLSRKISFATNVLALDTVRKVVRCKILVRLSVAPGPFTISCSIICHYVISSTPIKILMLALPQLILRSVAPRVQAIPLRCLALELCALLTRGGVLEDTF